MDKIQDIMARWTALQPLSDRDREMLSRRFTIDFNYNSNHIEGNTLTYGQTEILLLFGKIIGEAEAKDVQEMTASNVGLKMMTEEASLKDVPLMQNFIHTLHKTLLREDYTVYRNLPGGQTTSYVIHAGQYKTRPNSVITRYGNRFEYASPEVFEFRSDQEGEDFEDVLAVNEDINISSVKMYIDKLNLGISSYLAAENNARRESFLREIRHTFKSIDNATRRNVIDLKRNVDDTYKQEPNFKIKELRLKDFDEKPD